MARAMRRLPSRTAAFSLLELLVAITCIAMLGVLVMSSANRLLVFAHKAGCANNLRQVGAATSLYLGDHEQTFFPYSASTPAGKLWYFGLEPGGAGREGERELDRTKGALYPYLREVGRAGICRAFPYDDALWKPKFKGASFGYGYNAFLSGQRLLSFDKAAEIILFGDCAQVNTFQAPASPGRPMIEEFYMIEHTFKTIHFRHNQTAQFVFLDGHVEGMRPYPESLDTRLPEANVGRISAAGSMKHLQ